MQILISGLNLQEINIIGTEWHKKAQIQVVRSKTKAILNNYKSDG